MRGRQVLGNHIAEILLGGQRGHQFLERFQTAGRGADTDQDHRRPALGLAGRYVGIRFQVLVYRRQIDLLLQHGCLGGPLAGFLARSRAPLLGGLAGGGCAGFLDLLGRLAWLGRLLVDHDL